MGKIRSRSSGNFDPRPGRCRPVHPVIPVIGAALAVWLVFSGLAIGGTRTYEISSVRMRKTTSTSIWPAFKDGRQRTAADVERTETADGRWALETSGSGDEKDEGWLYGRFVDSTGKVIWEDTVGYANYLSTTHTAFVTSSPFSTDIRLYNLEVGARPLLTVRETSGKQIIQSPDGEAFALVGHERVTAISVNGGILGSFPLPDSERTFLCAALADSGLYVAIGESKSAIPAKPAVGTQEGVGGRPGGESTRDHRMRGHGAASRPRERAPGKGLSPGPSPTSPISETTYNGVAVYDLAGHLLGSINMPSQSEYPRLVTISGENPPRVAVASDKRTSVWTVDGRMIWQDSTKSGGSVLYFTRDRHLVSLASGAPGTRTLRIWDAAGHLDNELAFPSAVVEGAPSIGFRSFAGDSLRVETSRGSVVVRWSNGTK